MLGCALVGCHAGRVQDFWKGRVVEEGALIGGGFGRGMFPWQRQQLH